MLSSLGYLRMPYFYHPPFQVLEFHPEPNLLVPAMDLADTQRIRSMSYSTLVQCLTHKRCSIYICRNKSMSKCSVPQFPHLYSEIIANRVLWQ